MSLSKSLTPNSALPWSVLFSYLIAKLTGSRTLNENTFRSRTALFMFSVHNSLKIWPNITIPFTTSSPKCSLSSMRASCPAHLALLNLITVTEQIMGLVITYLSLSTITTTLLRPSNRLTTPSKHPPNPSPSFTDTFICCGCEWVKQLDDTWLTSSRMIHDSQKQDDT